MEFICPPCQQVTDSTSHICQKANNWFNQVNGEKLWRIRRLTDYAFQYLTDEEYVQLTIASPLILSDVRSWEGFDSSTLTGIDSSGKRTSIFN